MTPRSLRRLSRLLDAVAERLGRLAALLEVAADSAPAAEPVARPCACGRSASVNGRECLSCFAARVMPEAPRVPNACHFCGAPPGRVMCHGCPGVERGIA